MSSNDVYSLKEMIQEVRNDNKKALVKQSEISVTLNNIDEHLAALNSKVALNVIKIAELEQSHSNIKSVFSAFGILLTGAWAVITFIFKT